MSMTLRTALIAALALATTWPAGAVTIPEPPKPPRAVPAFLVERGPALAPLGHVVFCLANPAECRRPMRRAGRIAVSPARLAALSAVNEAVNAAIRPRPDPRRGGLADTWSLAPDAGDCEDFAITKRHALIAQGWPASQLRIATGITASGDGHAVLVVRTRRGDLVLDSRTAAIRPWWATGLRWVSMQSGAAPQAWKAI